MSLKIIPYVHGSELGDIIKKIKARADDLQAEKNIKIKFIVPSRKDRPWWLERAECEFYAPCQPHEVPWTWQELYEDICNFTENEPRSVISPPDHLLILRKILHNILNERPTLLDLWPGIKRPGFLDILSSDIHELLNEGVSPEQLNPHVEDIDVDNDAQNEDFKLKKEPEDLNDVSGLLHRAYADYLKYLEDNSLIDAAQIWTAAFKLLKNKDENDENNKNENKNLEWGRNYILVFTGFMSFTSGQLELVRLLKSRCKELIVIRPEANLKNFREAVSQLIGEPERFISKNHIKILETPAAEAGLEPEALARNLSMWSAGTGDFADKNKIKFPGFDAIGIMSPSGMEYALAEAMRRYHVPYYFNSGLSISQTLVGRILASIRALNNLLFPNYATAMLLTQPCFAGSDFSVFRAFRAGASGLANWIEYLEKSENNINKIALNAIKSIEKFCSAMHAGGTPEELMTAFYEFLTAKGLWLDRMRLNDIGAEFDDSLRLAASAIETVSDKILALHENMPDIGGVSKNILKDEDAFDFLEMWCRESFTRPPVKINGAVSIYSGQPPVLASYPVWIMLNVTQRVWPGRIQSSPLLSASDRENIALNGAYLPTVQDKATQREALFRRLILTGENLTILSRPEVDDENRPMSESPFMRRFTEDMDCDRNILKTASIKILTGNEDYIFSDIEPSRDIFNKNIIPVMTDTTIKSFGASDLDEILSCPFLWWLKSSGDIYERKMEIATPAQWGTLAHLMWEKIWHNFKLNYENYAKPEELFMELTRQEFEKFLPPEDESKIEINENENKDNGNQENENQDYAEYRRFASDPRLKRWLETFKFRFMRLADVQARILSRMYKNGFKHCDIWLEDEARLNLNLNNLNDENIYFSGQCDRIEVIIDETTGEKLAVITDYKSGKSENYESRTKINIDGEDVEFQSGLQLSAYALMFAEQHPDIKLAGLNFLGLKDGKLAGTFDDDIKFLFEDESSINLNKKNALTIKEREDEATVAISCAVNIIKGGKFAPDYGAKWCKSCGMKGICRRSEFIGERLSELDNNNFDNNGEAGDTEGE